MNLDYWLKIAEAIGPLLQAICWPIAVLALFVFFKSPLKDFLEDMGAFSVKAGNVELTATRFMEAGAFFATAKVVKDGQAIQGERPQQPPVREISKIVPQAIGSRLAKGLADVKLLWVDDQPENNTYERQALEALGVRIDHALSTEEAIGKARRNRYNAIITDMDRPPESEAGYILIETLRKMGHAEPVVIYRGRNTPEIRAEAVARGAEGSTNDPWELLRLVVGAITRV